MGSFSFVCRTPFRINLNEDRWATYSFFGKNPYSTLIFFKPSFFEDILSWNNSRLTANSLRSNMQTSPSRLLVLFWPMSSWPRGELSFHLERELFSLATLKFRPLSEDPAASVTGLDGGVFSCRDIWSLRTGVFQQRQKIFSYYSHKYCLLMVRSPPGTPVRGTRDSLTWSSKPPYF